MSTRLLRGKARPTLLGVLLICFLQGPSNDARGGIATQGIATQGIATQGIATQGIATQGIATQGIATQGIATQGIATQGIATQGIATQGIATQGIATQGIATQGLAMQGIATQGIATQGIATQGVAVMGSDLPAAEPQGVAIARVIVHGTTSVDTSTPFTQLTGLPQLSTGTGNYISVAGASAVGHYASAVMLDAAGAVLPDAESLDLYIAGEMRDPIPNLFHSPDQQDNEDELYVVYAFNKLAGQWATLCPYDARTQSASAMAIAEDPSKPGEFVFACTATGVAAKCARNWGYRPWASAQAWQYDAALDTGAATAGGWVRNTIPLRPYYEACKVAARAAYCQDDKSFTKNGTLVDLFDTSQIIWPNAIESPFGAAVSDSRWMLAQEYFVSTLPRDPLASTSPLLSALQRTRYRELAPDGQCAEFPFIDRLEHDHIEDGRWATTRGVPDIHVFSPTSCTHDEFQTGAALPWDCSPCTTAVCKENPSCCGAGVTSAGGDPWNSACVAKATASLACWDGSGNPLPGLVWPRDIPAATATAPSKYLLGAGGAVLRVDGVGAAAKLSGWACDPEWPGASTLVRVYAGFPREDERTQYVGEARATLPLASPLASEVSAVCDGPNRGYAQHGFELPLAGWTGSGAGNVFVYAIDEATSDGPAAPPTLLRNGIVHVPTCEHPETVAGAALPADCSPCSGLVCAENDACCTDAWGIDCSALASARCSPQQSSAPASAYAFTQIATGWLEAPATGNFEFDSSGAPSRLWINGTKVLDWGPWPRDAGDTATANNRGQIVLRRGNRYHIRWDRLQGDPSSAGPGLTWRLPSTSPFTDIPRSALYQAAPGGGSGLDAFYYSALLGGTTAMYVDPYVDINTDVAPPGAFVQDLPSSFKQGGKTIQQYQAAWRGEVVPPVSGDYVFHVVGTGTAQLRIDDQLVPFVPAPVSPSLGGACDHDLCSVGDQLDARCDPCVAAVCQNDPYCCDGGYHSYYSTEPTWDAKCISEVKIYCPETGGCAPPPRSTPPDQRTVTVALRAGVRHAIRLDYDNNYVSSASAKGTNKTVRLMWESAQLPKQAVPQYALYPEWNALYPQKLPFGAGLNVVYFPTKNGGTEPDLTAPVAAGLTPDLSGEVAIGQLGTPLVDVLAPEGDLAAGKPSPPMVVRPRYGETVFGAHNLLNAPNDLNDVAVTGRGGVPGDTIEIALELGTNFGNSSFLPSVAGGLAHVSVPVADDGTFATTVGVPGVSGPWQLRLRARNGAGVSNDVVWPFVVAKITTASKTLEIVSPRDPTYSPDPTATTFPVYGHGAAAPPGVTTPQPVTVRELAAPAEILAQDVVAAPDGTITGSITLSFAGTGPADDPRIGWHKLVFVQSLGAGGIAESSPVFVSVGIKPPVVTGPRPGAELGCSDDWTPEYPNGSDPPEPSVRLIGKLPYSEAGFGPLRVFEETGRFNLSPVPLPDCDVLGGCPTDLVVATTPGPDGLYDFSLSILPGPGKHVLRVFQAPDPPDGLTATELGAYFRSYAAVATTPTSQLVINETPPRFNFPPAAGPVQPGVPGSLREMLGISDLTFTPADMMLVDSRVVNLFCSCAGTTCGLCARPFADVILHLGNETFTTRANSQGGWELRDIPFGPGWTSLSMTQVADSAAGGAWSESCPSNAIQVGSGAINGVVHTPADMIVSATSPAGAVVSYPAVTADWGPWPMPVTCTPAPGATFPVGTTTVVCTAALDEPSTLAWGTFKVTVTDAAPVIEAPQQVVAEATDPMGATVDYVVTATDETDGDVTVDCLPPSGTHFGLGSTSVSCHATDGSGHVAQVGFSVLVVDTTQPELSMPASMTVDADASGSAVVTFTATAYDLVSGTVPVTCFPPSGSAFPVGTSPVNCIAKDAGGVTAQAGFTVTVQQTNTPPVVTVPDDMTVEAASATGTAVTFTASATDAQDGPDRPVTCTPAPGTPFPLGATTVSCTATDAGGMTGAKSFTVTVTDTKGPTWTNVPGTIVAYATSTAGAKVTYTNPTATDAVKGGRPVSCTPASGAQFPVNTTTVTCTATDGTNATSKTFVVWVQYQAPTDGSFFLIPIRSDGSSVFAVGRPVPTRFKLTGASKGIANLAATFKVTKISNTVPATSNSTSDETVDDTDFVFKYRPLLGFYVYRWRTRDQQPGTYRLTAVLGDGVEHQINVGLSAR